MACIELMILNSLNLGCVREAQCPGLRICSCSESQSTQGPYTRTNISTLPIVNQMLLASVTFHSHMKGKRPCNSGESKLKLLLILHPSRSCMVKSTRFKSGLQS